MKTRRALVGLLATAAAIAGSLVVASPAHADGRWHKFTVFGVSARGYYSDQNLSALSTLRSPSFNVELVMQTDGNLVVYRTSDHYPLWAASWTNPQVLGPNRYLAIQLDDNVVVYTSNKSALWASQTYHKCSATHGDHTELALQDDGNVVEYCVSVDYLGNASYRSMWTTNTRV